MAASHAKFYIQLPKNPPNSVPKRLHRRSFPPCLRFRGVCPGASCALCSEVTGSPVLPRLWGQACRLQGFCWGAF